MSGETTDFLYPFLEADERGTPRLLETLAESALAKMATSRDVADAALADADPELDRAAAAIAERVGRGGQLLVFGNGGSATDAGSLAALFRAPPDPIPARSLAEEPAVLSALANDVGFDRVLTRQVAAIGRADDVLVGFSTSGDSENLLRGFAEARDRALLTIGFAGSGGGQMAATADLDHCFVVASDSVHRTQETQAVLAFELWRRVRARREAAA